MVDDEGENSDVVRTAGEELRPGEIYSWAEVSRIHRVRNGIYHRDGKLISLLTDFGRLNPCYPDFHVGSRNRIAYTGYGRRGDQSAGPANRALLAAADSAHPVPLFNKLSVGRWEYLGLWTVAGGEYVRDSDQDRMLWKFMLERAARE